MIIIGAFMLTGKFVYEQEYMEFDLLDALRISYKKYEATTNTDDCIDFSSIPNLDDIPNLVDKTDAEILNLEAEIVRYQTTLKALREKRERFNHE